MLNKLKIPVVVIGNITLGGTGKTPLTLHIVELLAKHNIQAGVILRGYGGRNAATSKATIVQPTDNNAIVGDEALLYAQAGFPVVICRKRVVAAQVLIAHFPDVAIILADDGLQHYAITRDLEICVIDALRGFGNKQLLPCGPLREPLARLKTINNIVINCQQAFISHNQTPNYDDLVNKIMQINHNASITKQELVIDVLYQPLTKQRYTLAAQFNKQHKNILIMTAIGNPDRLLAQLTAFGIQYNDKILFADHYQYHLSDIPINATIITTAKDFTKLAKFALTNIFIAQYQLELTNYQDLLQTMINLASKSNIAKI